MVGKIYCTATGIYSRAPLTEVFRLSDRWNAQQKVVNFGKSED